MAICKYSFDIFLEGSKIEADIQKALEILFISNEKVAEVPPPNIQFMTADSECADIKVVLSCQKRNLEELRAEIKKSVEGCLDKPETRIDVKEIYP